MILAAALAFAQETTPHITFTHPPIREEMEEAKLEPLPMNASEGEQKSRDRTVWRIEHQKAATRNIDAALTWLMPTVEACYAGKPAATVGVRIVVSERAIVTQVKPQKGADTGLVGCLSSALLKKPIPAMTWSADATADYTFVAPAGVVAAPLPEPIDLDRGIGPVAFGDPPSGLTNARLTDTKYDVSFYGQQYDADMQVYGVEVASVQYLFSAEGFCGGILRFSGDENAYALRQGLKGRYGNPRWDPVTKSFYWRGKNVLIGTLQRPESHALVVTWIDMERMRKADLVSRLPGDANDTAQTGTIPKILRE